VTRSGWTLLLAVLFCLAVTAGCTTPADGRAAPVSNNGVGTLRDGAMQTAEQTAVALLSVDHRDPEAGYDRLLTLLTDPARQEWAQRRGAYLAPITESGAVTTEAVVQASGVAALDPAAGTATVLVAATATVSHQQAAPQRRRYRLQMSLIHTPDGWQVSQLQILQ
jgi:Mce-associated membrane protein